MPLVALHFAIAYKAPADEQMPRLYIMNLYRWNEAHGHGRYTLFPDLDGLARSLKKKHGIAR